VALDALAQSGLQDDTRFSNAYVRYRSGRGYGPRRIAQELRQRGISDEVSSEAFAAQACDWYGIARSARMKKFRAMPESLVERARQTRFMEYRGFDTDQIRYSLETH